MGRDVPFEENKVCDVCGTSGAYDFMGDYVCPKCSEPPNETARLRLALKTIAEWEITDLKNPDAFNMREVARASLQPL